MDELLTITVKHPCGHYSLHTITARNDKEAAQHEAALMQEPCRNCKQETGGDTLANIVIKDLHLMTKRNGA